MQTDKEYAAGHFVTDSEYLSHYQAYLNQPNRRDYLRYLVALFGETNTAYLDRFILTAEAELRRHEYNNNINLLGFDYLHQQGLNDEQTTDEAKRRLKADTDQQRAIFEQVRADVLAIRREQQATPANTATGRSFKSSLTDAQLKKLHIGLTAGDPVIHPGTDFDQFADLFRYKPLAEIEPVVWLKSFRLLEASLNALHNAGKIQIPDEYVKLYTGCFYHKRKGKRFKNVRQLKAAALNSNIASSDADTLITIQLLINSL